MVSRIDSPGMGPSECLHSSSSKKIYNPKSLRELASEKILVPIQAKPLVGASVPYAIENVTVRSLSGKAKTLSYATYPTICQLFKDVKVENPQIALIAYYLDQLGDIRILLNLRILIKERFGVEPKIIATEENKKRTLDFSKNSSEAEGLVFVDLDNISSSDCQGLDLLIHGPGIYGVELMSPKSILERYPSLKAALDEKKPPVLFSLLECESGSFSYSNPVNEVERVRMQVRLIRSTLLDPILEFCEEQSTEKVPIKQLPKRISEILPWALPILRGSRNILQAKDPALSLLLEKIVGMIKFLIENPDLPLNKMLETIERLKALEKESLSIVKNTRHSFAPSLIVRGMSSNEMAKMIIPQNDKETLVKGVQNLYELQMGLNPLFSLGWFKLPENLQNWLKQGLIDSAEGRKSIFKGIDGQTKQEKDLLKGLEKDPITGVERDSYYFGYGHSIDTILTFIKQAKANNPSGQVVVNMDIEEAELHIKDCNIYYYPANCYVDNKSAFTVHLYSRLNNPVFDCLMAASDPSCRLAGGDNTLFTTLMLGTDDLVYELRNFKQGMIIALFQLANEFSEEEKNCIVDRMLESASGKIMFELRSFIPDESQSYDIRKRKGELSQPGSAVYKSAFRKIGELLRKRAETFNDNFVGFMNLQMLGRRDPEFVAEVAQIVGDGQIFTQAEGFERVKALIDNKDISKQTL